MAKQRRALDILVSRVRFLMASKDMKPIQLAKHLKVSQSQVSLFINGKRGLSMEAIDRLTYIFGVSAAELFTEIEQAIPDPRTGESRRGAAHG